MQRTLKDKQRTLADDLKTITLELKSLKEKIVLQDSFVKKQLKERSESVELVREEISSYQSANEKIVAKITKLQAKIEELKSKANKYSNVDEQLADLRRIKKNMADSLKKVEKESTFYSEISECPTCKQNVGSDHKDHILVAIKEQEESIVQSLTSIEEDVKRVESRYNELTEYENEISAINSEVSAENRTVSINQELIKQKLRYIEKLNSDTDSIDEERLKLKQLAKDAVTTSDQKDKLSVTKQYYDVVQMLLQDSGIKSKIINQYIPVINKLINKYLTDLDFFANFNLDENFNEVIKSRYRDNFSYESFSEGQKLRLDLAIMFTWREVAKLKNSVNCNLLFMDELLDGSADNVGLDMALHLLRTFKDTNIFVISHREEVGDKFDATITMDLRNNFTYIKE
jgi:DNA repair exonuclease SbcCD ATPase subunit